MKYKEQYTKEILPQMAKKLGIVNSHALPRLEKIVLNVGVGEASSNKKVIEKVVGDLQIISGQKPIITLSKKSIATFKIRKGMPIGVKVTLRSQKMFDFLEKLTKIVLPRIRDFSGIDPQNIDRAGNLNIGLREQTLFPEIEYDKIDKLRGLQITIVVNAINREHSHLFLEALGIPFKK